MDGSRFDDLTRRVATSRRGLLKALLGAAGAGVASAAGHREAAACAVIGAPCSKADPCCTGRCSGGTCVCSRGSVACDGACVDTLGDPANCGGCGVTCAAGQVCQKGECRCQRGTTLCNGACLDTRTDPGNCGGCGVACVASSSCTDPVCERGACGEVAKADGASCDDGDACTQTDACLGGTCVGGNPVVCVASDQCHDPGSCDSATGLCSDPARADGSACNDGDACTQTDTCQGGVCTGSNPVVCPNPDACHDIGACDPTSGTCTEPTLKPGVCFIDGVCAAAGDAKAADPCQVCDPAKSTAAWTGAADGTPCSDANACTNTDTCQAGVCTPGTNVVCPTPGACQEPGVCHPQTGTCAYANKPDGTACEDGILCTVGDQCWGGICQPGPTKDCDDGNPCTVDGCNDNTGECFHAPVADGNACTDDGDLCTDDVCIGGVCTHPPKDCDDGDPCTDDSCDPGTGFCVNEPKDCADEDDCTFDFCDGEGVCQHEPIPACGPCEDPGCADGEEFDPETCACVCPAGHTVCGDACTDTRTDSSNCGRCGFDCNRFSGSCDLNVCVEGECRANQNICGTGPHGDCYCPGRSTCCGGFGDCTGGGGCCCPGQTCCVGTEGRARCCHGGCFVDEFGVPFCV